MLKFSLNYLEFKIGQEFSGEGSFDHRETEFPSVRYDNVNVLL